MPAYCVKCRSKTADVNAVQATTKNGRFMIKSVCTQCGSRKNEFISSGPNAGLNVAKSKKTKRGKGFWNVLKSIF